ncbi:MAG TPA: 50S ribosomal protein L35 [Candidatus Dormibacteraeota bacterium]|nr:50S ribosomal protein L35 [Candidatus Dormibacteraeota bacterium]
MPKLKTHSGTKDRVKITKKGKLLTEHSMTSHFLEKKSKSRKRKLSKSNSVVGKNKKSIRLRLGI